MACGRQCYRAWPAWHERQTELVNFPAMAASHPSVSNILYPCAVLLPCGPTLHLISLHKATGSSMWQMWCLQRGPSKNLSKKVITSKNKRQSIKGGNFTFTIVQLQFLHTKIWSSPFFLLYLLSHLCHKPGLISSTTYILTVEWSPYITENWWVMYYYFCIIWGMIVLC